MAHKGMCSNSLFIAERACKYCLDSIIDNATSANFNGSHVSSTTVREKCAQHVPTSTLHDLNTGRRAGRNTPNAANPMQWRNSLSQQALIKYEPNGATRQARAQPLRAQPASTRPPCPRCARRRAAGAHQAATSAGARPGSGCCASAGAASSTFCAHRRPDSVAPSLRARAPPPVRNRGLQGCGRDRPAQRPPCARAAPARQQGLQVAGASAQRGILPARAPPLPDSKGCRVDGASAPPDAAAPQALWERPGRRPRLRSAAGAPRARSAQSTCCLARPRRRIRLTGEEGHRGAEGRSGGAHMLSM
jgi:hypothetical protein